MLCLLKSTILIITINLANKLFNLVSIYIFYIIY